jgi:hypothetical protein
VVVVVAAIVGIFYYQVYVAPFQRTVLTVDGNPIRMDYFIKRTNLAGAEPMYMLTLLGDEQLIKQEAPRYVGEPSPEDMDQEWRMMAAGSSHSSPPKIARRDPATADPLSPCFCEWVICIMDGSPSVDTAFTVPPPRAEGNGFEPRILPHPLVAPY